MSGSAHGAEPEAVVETVLHRAPAECKVLATVVFVVAVALVPRGPVFWPYAIDAALLALVAVAAQASPRFLAGRLAMEAPFVLFVVLLPLVSGRAGLWLALGILCKATLAVLATGVLAWTTPAPDILRGAERLGAPRQLTAIAGFALRYLQLLLDELRRMRLARAQRGDDARWLWQAQGLGRTLSALAVRSFERGERVHTAMLARGYDGRMPALDLAPRAPAVAWPAALVLPVAALAVLAAARGVDVSAALLVVGHGSRDADGVEEFWQLADHVRAAAAELPVGFGFIELTQPLVDAGIDELVARGSTDVVSIPLVLLAAGHLKNDGPAALARARLRHPGVAFRMGRDLGIDPAVLAVAEERARDALGDADPADTAVVLVARGSSDPDATSDLFKVARLLADKRGLGLVEAAFAGVARPGVTEALERCRRLGARRIAVVPFFLFTGVLVPRIYAEAADWALEHPDVDVRAGGHLGPDRRLARVVLERYREALTGPVRMNCDLCTYRVRLPGYEDKVGMPISLTPHGDGPARGLRRVRRATRAPLPPPAIPRPAPASALAEGTPPALELRGLRYAYPDGTAALAGVDLRVAPGERLAVLGPNGAGKTTLALAACGALEDLDGTVAVGGEVRPRAELRRRVGIVFQDPDDQLFMPTVEADVAFGPAKQGLRGDVLRERVASALAAVGLSGFGSRAPHALSAGERRRAAIAGVLACEPDVLVLDEPTGALDPAARRELLDVLVSLRIAVLLVTHDLPYALELCPRAVVLDRGQVVADGPAREILSDAGFMAAHRLELPAGFNPLAA